MVQRLLDLRQSPFGHLNLEALVDMARSMVEARYPAGHLLWSAGDASTHSLHIEAGRVRARFLEDDAPLLKDNFVQSLDFNAAGRFTDYSTSGQVQTWKLGLTWQLVESFRIRGTKSRDIRAPNVSELFGPNTRTFGILNDPARGGLQTNPVVVSGSNGKLVPEVGDTWTAGFVVQPAIDGWLGRVQMSVDYYDIDLKNSIGNLGAQTIATRCFCLAMRMSSSASGSDVANGFSMSTSMPASIRVRATLR